MRFFAANEAEHVIGELVHIAVAEPLTKERASSMCASSEEEEAM
jgi:hypothetical protein